MVIKINPLDKKSIKDAEKQIERYRKELAEKMEQIVRRLTNDGLLKAREFVPVSTGVAQSSIVGYVEEGTGRGIIRAGGYCAFIEFGTGIKGENSPHPSPEYIAAMNWAYNVGSTIFTTKDGRTGWFFPTKEGGWKFTEGMPSRPFMYETARYLKDEYVRVAREIFDGKGSV